MCLHCISPIIKISAISNYKFKNLFNKIIQLNNNFYLLFLSTFFTFMLKVNLTINPINNQFYIHLKIISDEVT